MLQFSTFMYNNGKSRAPKLFWRFSALFSTNPAETVSAAKDDVKIKDMNLKSTVVEVSKKINTSVPINENVKPKLIMKEKIKKEDLEEQLKSTTNIDQMLNIAENSILDKETATLLLTTIVRRINSNVEETLDCANDKRFKKIQDVLFATELKVKSQLTDPKIKHILSKLDNGDTHTISELSVSQMIEVLQNVSMSRTRPAPLLRLLSKHITKEVVHLNMRQCASLLYSLASLKFHDKPLLECIKKNILVGLKTEENKIITWRIISIIKSIGVLHYKDEELLHKLCSYSIYNMKVIKAHELQNFVETIATLNYKTNEAMILLKMCVDLINRQTKWDKTKWLDLVWALAMFQEADSLTISNALNEEFIDSLNKKEFTILRKLKLLNINAAAQYEINEYIGNTLPKNSEIYETPLIRQKEKEAYTQTLSETLDQILPSKEYFQTNVNTHMGFLLDAEYCVDSNGNSVALEWTPTVANITRIGIMIHHYNDYCVLHPDLLGRVAFYKRLLSAKGYKVISIDYRDFSPADSCAKRLDFIKNQMKLTSKQI